MCVRVLPPALFEAPVPSEGEPHVTIAPADPASATRVTEESDGPGAALLRTLTQLTADLPDADPGRVAAAAAARAGPPPPTRRSCGTWPPKRRPG